MTNTGACRHALGVSEPNDAMLTEGVGILNLGCKHPRDDFHIGVTVRTEARCRCNSIVVAYEQESMASVCVIDIGAETETVL
jgi:hypothetical protein